MANHSRRHFLSLAAAGLAGVPLLGSFARRSRAAGDGPARRLVVFFSPNGTIPQFWTPSGSGSNYAFPAGSILEPLAGLEDQLLLIEGLDFYEADNHEGGMAAMLTGKGGAADLSGGMSIDQFVAAQLGAATKFPSLEFGVQTSAWGGNVQTRMSYAGPGEYVTPDDDPLHVYDRMFGDFVGGDDAAAKLMARRQRAIDVLAAESSALRGRLDPANRTKLDAHLEALAQLEQSLGAPLGCAIPEAPIVGAHTQPENFPAVAKAQIDLLVMALACDMTRVASLQMSHTVGPIVCSWLGVSEGHHSLSHAGDGDTLHVADFVKTERWFAEQFRYLVEQLAGLPEPGGEGSMLDNSIVLWAKEMGDARAHVCKGVPFVMAGHGGGAFTPGRRIELANESHTRLLVSICQAMGLSNEQFGNSAFPGGALTELA
ncbi:DUF1552 domain-containing protein [Nannocystaceae bacterium ST9]